MLEAKDMDNVDIVSPFLDAILNTYWGTEDANVTRTNTLYVDMVRYWYQKCELIGWSKEELEKLKTGTRHFKAEERKKFSSCQNSSMEQK